MISVILCSHLWSSQKQMLILHFKIKPTITKAVHDLPRVKSECITVWSMGQHWLSMGFKHTCIQKAEDSKAFQRALGVYFLKFISEPLLYAKNI